MDGRAESPAAVDPNVAIVRQFAVEILKLQNEHTIVHDDHRIHLDRGVTAREALERRVKEPVRWIRLGERSDARNFTPVDARAA